MVCRLDCKARARFSISRLLSVFVPGKGRKPGAGKSAYLIDNTLVYVENGETRLRNDGIEAGEPCLLAPPFLCLLGTLAEIPGSKATRSTPRHGELPRGDAQALTLHRFTLTTHHLHLHQHAN
jgi:hypothetical protein